MRKFVAASILSFGLSLSAFGAVGGNAPAAIQHIDNSFYRTELYLGRSIPDGGMVSDVEWDKFLADVVTPRFPDGFTIMNATGQYREKSGKIDKEPSEVLVFLYPKWRLQSSRRKIEEIRRAYIKQFKQESVLRLDFRQPVVVRF